MCCTVTKSRTTSGASAPRRPDRATVLNVAESRARKFTGFRIASEVLDSVDAHAQSIGSDRSAVIRQAVAEYCDRHGVEVPAQP